MFEPRLTSSNIPETGPAPDRTLHESLPALDRSPMRPDILLAEIDSRVPPLTQVTELLQAKLVAANFPEHIQSEIMRSISVFEQQPFAAMTLRFLASDRTLLHYNPDGPDSTGSFYTYGSEYGFSHKTLQVLQTRMIEFDQYAVIIGNQLHDYGSWGALLIHEGTHALHGYVVTSILPHNPQLIHDPMCDLLQTSLRPDFGPYRGPQQLVALQEIIANYAATNDWELAYQSYRVAYSAGNLFGEGFAEPLLTLYENTGVHGLIEALKDLSRLKPTDTFFNCEPDDIEAVQKVCAHVQARFLRE